MPANPTIIFDIETSALPFGELAIPAFNPADVKLGNTRDPDKIAERIRQPRRATSATTYATLPWMHSAARCCA